MKLKRQGLIVTTGELYRLIEDLEEEFEWKGGVQFCDEERKFQINIINKEGLSDTWMLEKKTSNKSQHVKSGGTKDSLTKA